MSEIEDMLKGFKPAITKTDVEIVAELLKIKPEEVLTRFSSITCKKDSIRRNDRDMIRFTVKFATKHDKPKEEVYYLLPEDFGYSKETDILVGSLESNVVTGRKIASGYYLSKVHVKINDSGAWSKVWLFWSGGRIMEVNLRIRDCLTQELSIQGIQFNDEIGDFKKAFAERVLVPTEVYRDLKAKGMVFYTLSKSGNIEV